MKYKKVLILFSIIIVIFLGFHFSKISKIKTITYQSLTEYEKVDVIKNSVSIKKIHYLPTYATIKDEKYSNENLYSVTYKTKSNQEDFVYFVDSKKEKVIGGILRK
ncbi:hypothetical protein [Bacillus sp. EAC]|uniref:hypothetical protein n=1 Tax=Bacillus sp. EAC TaxID=1978338 RepID=UPI000B438E67|nr:hypothetical protein [Bacillus sp. EAC]